jgi:NAD(P)-dependent dehydrogenase (short-subunit alcohol dehydrogenase family)
MNTPPAQRLALVTGIGFETCRQLGQRGLTVILGARNAGQGERAAAQLRSEGLSVTAQQLDVTDAASVNRLAAWLAKEHGYLDVLVNNAAINLDQENIVTEASMDEVRQMFESNVVGPWQMVQACLPLLRAGRSQRVVNVSSESGAQARLDGGAPGYRLSKYSLNGLTLALARTLAADGIKVNAVCPGWVATDMGNAGGRTAPRSIPEGGASVVWAALLPDDGPTGGFFRDGQPMAF